MEEGAALSTADLGGSGVEKEEEGQVLDRRKDGFRVALPQILATSSGTFCRLGQMRTNLTDRLKLSCLFSLPRCSFPGLFAGMDLPDATAPADRHVRGRMRSGTDVEGSAIYKYIFNNIWGIGIPQGQGAVGRNEAAWIGAALPLGAIAGGPVAGKTAHTVYA